MEPKHPVHANRCYVDLRGVLMDAGFAAFNADGTTYQIG